MENPNCITITKKGSRCSRKKKVGEYCTQHSKSVVGLATAHVSPVVTVTYGDVAENGPQMEQLGDIAKQGFTMDALRLAHRNFSEAGCVCELVDLRDYLTSEEDEEGEASILIVRGGVDAILRRTEASKDDMLAEQLALDWDTKSKMRGRVVNKLARHNLCYADFEQDPNYDEAKGRVIKFADIPHTAAIRSGLIDFVGEEARGLLAEGNKYYDPSKCGIGFHGDFERRKVIAVRLGGDMEMHYQWFQQSKPIGERFKTTLHHGDLYIMSEKAVGTDWKKRIIRTLRHAAGCSKYTTISK